MNGNQPFVSVIIPVLNDPLRLQTCLQALAQQTYPPERYEIIVVDNGSDEHIEPIILQFDRAQSTLEPKRSSYAARNRGIQLAKGDILAFTDADCIPTNDWLATGVERLTTTPNCGLVGGRIEIFVSDPQHRSGVEIYDQLYSFPQHIFVEQSHYGATANMFTFRRIFDAVGLFDASLQSGGDYEWGNRVYAAGYAQAYAPEVCVQHPSRSTLRELYKQRVRIARGHHTLKKRQALNFTPASLWQRPFPDLMYTAKVLFGRKFVRKLGISTPSERIGLVAAIWFVHYVELFEAMRLNLRENSDNKSL